MLFSATVLSVTACAAQEPTTTNAAVCQLPVWHCETESCSSDNLLNLSIPIRTEYRGDYDRQSFANNQRGGWSDDDSDCQNTRAEVLIETSLIPVVYGGSSCWVTAGLWYDKFSDKLFEDPGEIDIDHVVALKEAHESGAFRWDTSRRSEFANDYKLAKNLVPMWNSTNRSKGSLEPYQWLPPNEEAWCGFANRWTFVKWFWELSVDEVECQFLTDLLGNCVGDMVSDSK